MKKLLLFILIIGSLSWIISEIMEIRTDGYADQLLTVNLIAFIALGLGWFGLHKSQTDSDRLSLWGSLLVTLGFLTFAAIALQVIMAGERPAEEVVSPGLIITAMGAMLVGSVLFGISVLRIKFFPAWSGVAFMILMLSSLASAATETYMVEHLSNILIAGLLLWMTSRGLKG